MDINIFGRKTYPCTGPSPQVNNARSLTPKINIHLMAYKKKQTVMEIIATISK
jgi:hypothetical protein